ncbi:MAG: glycine oxidase ThiO [Gammaproteobacteria bacterium]|nr:glycine oxidase ThiO [Gammaproteobacteria bacterium]
MNTGRDVIVVGGGVIGLLTARELRAHGLSVTLLERDRIGQASSQAGGGILSPIPPWEAPTAVTALASESAALFPQLAASLYDSTDVDIEYLKCGVLLLAAEINSVVQDWARRSAQVMETVDAAQLHDMEPRLHHHWSSGLLLPNLAQLRNPRFTRALHQDLLQSGVTVLEHTPATKILDEADRVTGVQTSGGNLNCSSVVVATGAWTSALLGQWSVTSIEPVRGQMLWYQLAPGTFSRIVVEGDQYLIPRRDGVCLVGSTVEHVGFEDTTTPEATEMLATFAARLSPDFAECRPAGQWSGLRPGIADGIPVISGHPRLSGLYINAGHFRNGINLAPASARLVSELVLGRKTSLDSGPYCAENRL